MIEVREQVHILRPQEDVFAFLTDLDNFMKWQEGLVAVELLVPGPWRAGTRIKTTHSLLLWKTLLDYSEITHFEAGKGFRNRGDVGKTHYEEEFVLEPDSGGTLLKYTANIRAGGIFTYIQPLAAWAFRQQMKRSFRKLKLLLESSPLVADAVAI